MKTRNVNPAQKIAAVSIVLAALISMAMIHPPFWGKTAYAEPVTTLSDPSINLQDENSEKAVSTQDTFSPPPPPPPTPKPVNIVLENGASIAWDELSESDKAKLRDALQKAQQSMQLSINQVRNDLNTELISESIQKARESMKKAMEGFDGEWPDFDQDWEKLSEMMADDGSFMSKIRKAMEEAREELRKTDLHFHSPEFREEMEKLSEELRIHLGEPGELNMDWDEFMSDMGLLLKETGGLIETIAPMLNELFEELEPALKEIFRNFDIEE